MKSCNDRGDSRSQGLVRGVLRAAVPPLLGLALGIPPAQAAPFAYVTNGSDDTVSVIDTATNTVVATVAVEEGARGVAVSPDGARVYVVSGDVDTVPDKASVIDTATNLVTATVEVGLDATGVATSPDGTRVYVTNKGRSDVAGSAAVSVIDTATETVVATVPLLGDPADVGPLGVVVSPDGGRVYVTDGQSDVVSVIDAASNTVAATAPVGNSPLGVAVSPDGAHVYVVNSSDDNVSVLDTATNTVTATVGVGPAPFGVAVTPDGSRVYVTNRNSDSVSVIRTTDNTVATTVPVGDVPVGVSVTPDGARVYIANRSEDTVSVIRTADNTVIDTVAVGDNPTAFGQFIGPLAITIGEVIALFDDAVADGNVQGQGSGKSARDRLSALRNMLVTAADLLAQGDVAAACVQLQDAANRTDGASPPSDFVQGPAAADLFDAITALRGQLGCSG
jgi:YVTN family beta-propeller protein